MLHEKVTVLVPQGRLSEFYGRFGDFMLDRLPAEHASESSEGLHQVGAPPAWTTEPGAVDLARKFCRDVTDPGRELLRVLIDGAERESSTIYTPRDSSRRPERKRPRLSPASSAASDVSSQTTDSPRTSTRRASPGTSSGTGIRRSASTRWPLAWPPCCARSARRSSPVP